MDSVQYILYNVYCTWCIVYIVYCTMYMVDMIAFKNNSIIIKDSFQLNNFIRCVKKINDWTNAKLWYNSYYFPGIWFILITYK